MRLAAGAVANGVAWLVLAVLGVGAILVTNRLGFVGLVILGGLTWLVCTRASLDEKVPTWGVGVFSARMAQPRSAEERAAVHADHEAALLPLRFYGRCGAFLATIGAIGFAWQTWVR